MSLGEHIEELRQRIFRAVGVLAVFWIVGWFLQPYVYQAINGLVAREVAEYLRNNPQITPPQEPFRNLTEPFMLKFRLSFWIGLTFALPYIVLEIWGFVKPGLKPEERKPIVSLAPMSVFLFGLGAFFCWMALPATIGFFLSFLTEFPGTTLFQEPGAMVFFVIKLMLAFGIGFQLPLVMYLVAKIGIVSPDTMSHYWRHSIVFVFVTSALLTPSTDIPTMLMMAVPLTILMMISLFFIKITMRNKHVNDPELNDLD